MNLTQVSWNKNMAEHTQITHIDEFRLSGFQFLHVRQNIRIKN